MRRSRYRAPSRVAVDRDPSLMPALTRRGVLIATGAVATGLACTGSNPGDPPGTGGTGTGGATTGGSGGASGAGGATGGSPGTGGSGGAGTGGTSGSGGAGTGGSGGTGGRDAGATGGAGGTGTGGSGGRDAGATGGTGGNFPSDARIEVGSPPGMDGGATMSCRETEDDQLGPYYRPGHIERAQIATAADGEILIVTGRVLNTRCQPLVNAKVDVWQANGRGVYSEIGNGWGRGYVMTDAAGNYKYETVYPGPYQGRPRHIHLIVTAPGHGKLTTQMYFVGANPDIAANAVRRTVMGSTSSASWDIVLRPTGSAALIRPPSPGRRPPGGRIIQPREIPRRFWLGWRPPRTA